MKEDIQKAETIGQRRSRQIRERMFRRMEEENLTPEVAADLLIAETLADGMMLGKLGISSDMPAEEAEKILAEKEAEKNKSKPENQAQEVIKGPLGPMPLSGERSPFGGGGGVAGGGLLSD